MEADTPRIEEYLESIFKLQQIQHPVTLSRLAEHLKLSLPSVSEMVKKLVNKGLVGQTEKGICLTEKGNSIAIKVIRRHRLSERLLTDILGFKWDKVHEEACRLEHDISPEIEEKIEEKLGNPRTCPHGYPIPDKEGQVARYKAVKLSELKAGEKGVIVSVFEENTEVLQYVGSLGLYPEVEVEVKSVAPFGGPILVRMKNVEKTLGKELAEKILVQRK